MCGKDATQDRARDGDEGVAAPGPVDPIEEEILLIQLLKDVPQRLQFRAEAPQFPVLSCSIAW
jgi:hypothetical protein